MCGTWTRHIIPTFKWMLGKYSGMLSKRADKSLQCMWNTNTDTHTNSYNLQWGYLPG